MSISSRSNSSSYGYTSSGSTSSDEDTYEYDTFETIQNVDEGVHVILFMFIVHPVTIKM